MSKNKDILTDKRYASLNKNFQSGNIVKSQSQLKILMKDYPNSPELIEIKKKLYLKANHNRVSKLKNKKITIKQIFLWSSVILFIGLIIWGSIYGVQEYQRILAEKTLEFEQNEQLSHENDLIANKMETASKLIDSGRYADAITVLEEIESLVSNDPGFQEALKRANDGIFLISVYDQAISLGGQQNFEAALEKLEIIKNVNPDFRDVQILIEDYEHEIELINYLQLANEAYDNGNWESAILYYEEYLLDVENNDKLEEKQKLYNTYLNVMNENLSEETLVVEIIEESEYLLSKARSLYLHNAIEYSFEDNRRIQDLLIAKFTTLAEQSIEEAPDSINAIKVAEYYFSKALQLQPYSDQLIEQYVLINSFLTGYADFINGNWEDAEVNLRIVYESDPSFAGGLIEVLLYETYAVIGNLYEEIEFFVSANNNYELAAVIANNNPDNELRIFEASVNLARMQAKFGSFRTAAFLFQDAFDDSAFYLLSQYYGGTYGENLAIAYENINISYYYTAYQYFIAALEETPEFIIHNLIWLQDDDTLAKYCLEFSSTYSFIFEFNDFNYSMLPLQSGAGIIIPSIP